MDQRQADVRKLLEVEAKWNRSTWTADTAFLNDLLDADFRLIGLNGKSFSKRQVISFVKDTSFKIAPFRTQNVEIRFYGNVAILTGSFVQTFTYKGATHTRTIGYTDVYKKQKRKWVALSAQATLLSN